MKNLISLILFILFNFCILKSNGIDPPVNIRGGNLEEGQYNCVWNLYSSYGILSQFNLTGGDYNFCDGVINTCDTASYTITTLNVTYPIQPVGVIPASFPHTGLDCIPNVTTVLLSNQNLDNFKGNVPTFIKTLTIKNSFNVFPLPQFSSTLDTLVIENDKDDQNAHTDQTRNLTIDFASIQNVALFYFRDSFRNVNYNSSVQFTSPPRLQTLVTDLCDIPDLTNLKISITMYFYSNDLNYLNKTSYIKFSTFNLVSVINFSSIKPNVSIPFPYQLQNVPINTNFQKFSSLICFDPVQSDQIVNFSNLRTLYSFFVYCPKANDRSYFPIKQLPSSNIYSFNYLNSNFTSLDSLDIFLNVRSLSLQSNDFNGVLPKKNTIAPLYIDFSLNNFDGVLDKSYCNSHVNITGNKLITSIPTCFTCHMDATLKEYFIGINYLTSICTTLIPKLTLSNSIVTLFGYDLGLETSNFISEPALTWTMVPVLNGTTFQANTSTITGFSSLNTMIIRYIGVTKANFTLSLKSIAPEFQSISIGNDGSFQITGKYFTYDPSDVTILVIGQQQTDQIQCSTTTFDHLNCGSAGILLATKYPLTKPPIVITESIVPIDVVVPVVDDNGSSGLSISLSTMALTIGSLTTKVYFNNVAGALNNQTCTTCAIGQICNIYSGVCVQDQTPTPTSTSTPTPTCKNNCSNQGTCIGGICSCFTGRLFDDCSGISCTSDCSSSLGQGDCNTSVGTCKCNSKYTGSNCDLPNHFVSSNTPCSIDGGLVVLNGWFGGIHNGLSVFIGDSNCSVGFINSTEIQCTITLGSTGIKSLNVTQNNIIWFGNNQYEYVNTIKQCTSCSSHGICDTSKGICVCNTGYKGYDCLGVDSTTTTSTTTSTTQEPTIVIPVSKPIVNTTSGGAAIQNEQTNYKILLKSIVELDINGGIVYEYQLDGKWTLSNSGSVVSGSVITTFTQPIYNTNTNNNESIITSSIEDLSIDKNYTFAGIDFTVTAGSIKVSVEILKWSYSSSLNTLQLRMESLVTNDENNDIINTCNGDDQSNISSDKQTDNSNLNNVKIEKDAKILYGRFLGRALSDGYSTFITNQIVSNSSTSLVIGINLPHCFTSCILDPDFSVLVSNNFKSADSCVSEDNSKPWLLPVAIVVPVVGASIVAVASVIIYRKNRTNIKIGISKLRRV